MRGVEGRKSTVDSRRLLTQSRVVEVALLTLGVEGLGLRFVEGQSLPEALRQVGIGNEEFAPRNCVRISGLDRRFRALLGEVLVGNIDAAELFFKLRPEFRTVEGFP